LAPIAGDGVALAPRPAIAFGMASGTVLRDAAWSLSPLAPSLERRFRAQFTHQLAEAVDRSDAAKGIPVESAIANDEGCLDCGAERRVPSEYCDGCLEARFGRDQ
jgi:hypothetical protein